MNAFMQHARRWACAAIVACIYPAVAPAQDCPSVDPNANYNCPVGPVYTLPAWGNVPWTSPEYFRTIAAGDLDGDGRDELIGRDARGVQVWSFDVALGTWRPWLASDRSGVLILPLSDAAQWNLPQYFSTITLIDFPGVPGKALAARSNAGLVVYRLTRGSIPGVDLPAGEWTQVTTNGPFSDNDCFANEKCWNQAPYYQTIRFGDLDGEPGDEVIGWGGDGIVAFKWNGSNWSGITGLPGAGDAAQDPKGQYLTLQFADVDGKPGQELLQWAPENITPLRYVPGQSGGRWEELSGLQFGLGCDGNNSQGIASCWATLQTASMGAGGALVMQRVVGCSAAGGGMSGARYDAATRSWTMLFSGGPFDDCAGFTKPQYYETIQTARITGNAMPELIGRGPGGILVYQWNGTSWVPLSTNVPALSDAVWASDASYWQTIRTANVDGSGRAALIARGQTGVRTWLWQNGALARPQAYGSFPQFTGDKATAYNALNQFLALGQGTIRDTYANPAVDNSSSQLRSYVSQIVRGGCGVEISANPPQYQSCTPLTGTTNPAYTTVVNQIVKELWWAASATDYFTTIQTMQNALFIAQGNEFPSIQDNLQLGQAATLTGTADYLALFSSISTVVSDIVGVAAPRLGYAIGLAADAVNVGLSAAPFFESPPGSTMQHTYAQIQGQIATIQQTAQATNLAQKHHVLSDYGLLSSIGQLTASQVWTLDEAGYQSANRLAFTRWVYQVFLPLLWSHYQVTGCGQNETSTLECYPPPNGPNMAYYQLVTGPSNNWVNFTGILPISSGPICVESNSGGGGGGGGGHTVNTCTFPPAPAAMVNLLTSALPPQCTYNPQAGTAWVYANPNANPPVAGCTLGAAPAVLTNQLGWNLPVTQINLQDGAIELQRASRVVYSGRSNGVRVRGLTHDVGPGIDWRSATLTVRRVLHEAQFAGELVNAGDDLVPTTLRPAAASKGRGVTFESPAGVSPRIAVEVQDASRRGFLEFDLRVDASALAQPLMCLGTPARTRLHVSIEIAGGGLPAPRTLSQAADWECVFDRNGMVKELRATGGGVQSIARQ